VAALVARLRALPVPVPVPVAVPVAVALVVVENTGGYERRCAADLIKALAERLAAKGKPFKLVMTACIRKLLTLLNAVLRRGTPWVPAPA
jgi:transposase